VRIDDRAVDELRPVVITPGYTEYAEGSVLIEVGRTRVLCNASTEDYVPRWLRGRNQGWVTAEYALLPRATQERTPRERTGWGGRTQEIRRMIGRSLRAAVDLTRLGERTIVVDCDVIQADGGTRTASVTGGYVALALAVRRLLSANEVSRRVLRAPVAAVSVGILDGQPLLDLSYAEDLRADVDLNVAMTSRGEYVELQGTAEGEPFDGAALARLLELAGAGIRELLTLQRQAL
jgi:ribonuclease PH